MSVERLPDAPGVEENLRNLLALQAAAYRFFTLDDEPSVAERIVLTQSLGDEVEQRARLLIAVVQSLRGVEPAAPVLQFPTREPEPEPESSTARLPDTPAVRNRKLTGAIVRDAIKSFHGGAFSESELVAELVSTPARVRPFLKAFLAADPPQLREAGRAAGKKLYEWITPAEAGIKGPREHETKTPPEKLPPAGVESRATGLPVRVSAADKSTRRARSTPGQRHKIVQRDRRYEAMQEAKRQRAAGQQRKAHESAQSGGGRRRK